jgi:hypothetical protein
MLPTPSTNRKEVNAMSREYGFQPYTIARGHALRCVLLALALLGWCLVMSSCELNFTANNPGLSATPSSDPVKATVVPTRPVDKTKSVDNKDKTGPVDKTSDVTPTPTVQSDQQVVENFIEHYVGLVFSQLFRRAYTKLSASLRNSETYDDFVQDPNYTLPKGCWREGKSQISQLDDQTWVEGVEMMQVSCVDGNVMVYDSWVFHVSLADGPPEIIAIGLYPTAAGN